MLLTEVTFKRFEGSSRTYILVCSRGVCCHVKWQTSFKFFCIPVENIYVFVVRSYRSSHRRFSVRKVVRNFGKFTGKHLRQSLFFNSCKKETLTQVFCCEFCEISVNTFFAEYLWTTASNCTILLFLFLLTRTSISSMKLEFLSGREKMVPGFFYFRCNRCWR